MRKSARLLALGTAIAATFGTASVILASPAQANHVVQPSCDTFRQVLISAQTAVTNSAQELGAAQTAYDNANANLGSAAAQLVTPTFNLVQALENEVGVATAQSAFDAAMTVFNSAVSSYVSAFTNLVTLQATHDVNTQMIPYLEGVIGEIDGLLSCVLAIVP